MDVLELMRIVEVLEGDARAVFMDIVARRAGTKPGRGRRGSDLLVYIHGILICTLTQAEPWWAALPPRAGYSSGMQRPCAPMRRMVP